MFKRIKNNKQLKLLTFLAILLSITTIAFTYGAIKSGTDMAVSHGIIEDTVYINDLDSDYYYYTGQNYTNSTDGKLPTLNNKNLYNDNNLVKVIITYDGEDYNTKKTGYVSLTENQSKLVYYKYYPVENGYINIELIDNPFNNHPDDTVFNGWITDYQNAKISYDDTYYTRTLTVPVTYTGGIPNDIEITMHASWIKGAVSYVNGSFNNVFNDLNDEGMNKVNTSKDIYEYPSVDGYYKSETITTTTTVISSGGIFTGPETETNYGTCTDCYDEDGNYYNQYNEYTCDAPSLGWRPSVGDYTNDCTIFRLQDENDEYDPNATYYTRNSRGGFVEANLEPIYVGSEDDENFNENTNMSGYYRAVNINYRESIDGYYNNVGTVQSGTCNTRSGCTYYELIQFYNNGTEELYNKDETYYYLTTRDTNLVVMTGNTSSTWSSSNTKPFTLTGIYNGHDYNATWNVNNTGVTCYNDTRIEELTINGGTGNANTDPSNNSNTRRVFYGNYFNVKLGRNIKQSGNNVNFVSIIGANAESGSIWGNTTIGSASNPKKYKLEVESGKYNSTSSTYGASTSSRSTILYVEQITVYGNDYDRVTQNNDKLSVYYCASGSWSGRIHSSNDTLISALNTNIKSGSFGTGKLDISTGVYVGGRYGGTHYAPRSIKVEGGYIYNLNGGPLTEETDSKGELNDTFIYMTGGSIDAIFGGAGTTTTYGNRIIQVTGGTVNYSVFGGSNGTDGGNADGAITGDTYVYIGGTATIGTDDNINNNRTLWGAESGSVFGAGNGNTRYATIGSVNNSNIIINDKAVVKQNVYGSGNYGTVGYSGSGTSNTNIQILGGTIGSAFGSGNHSGSGRNGRVTSSINISMTNGTVKDSIYGGSNQEGTVYGSANITLSGGQTKDVYGGGLGSDTYVSQDINIQTTSDNLTVTGSIYGGSAYGVVNATSKTTNQSNYNINININGGNINSVFGGAKGSTSQTPYVGGNTTVNINNGKITNVYGGNDANGQPNGMTAVYLNNGTVTNVYGGGNQTLVTNTHVYQNGSTVTNLFGGSNQSGDVSTSTIIVTGGATTSLYGGNNVGGQTTESDITVNSGDVTTLYGGGKLTDTDTSNILINNGNIGDIYGGGEEASIISSTNIDVKNGNINSVYGGSNKKGDVKTSNIDINGAKINSVYGGNNQGGVTNQTNVNLYNGQIENVYGGGNETNNNTSNVILEGSTCTNIFGGGNNAGIDTSNINLTSGTATNIYGGSNQSGEVSKSNIESNNPQNLSVTNLYGGNNLGGITNDANINLNGGHYTNIYGGGNMTITDKTTVNVNNIDMDGAFYGGGNQAGINTNTNVTFKNSSIKGDLFGGGNLGSVNGNTNVYVSNSNVSSSIYAGGNGASAVVNGNTTLNIDNNTTVGKHVFGGGNAANTGTEEKNNSESKVQIAGATIHGNVYGGANTAILYGIVDLVIGNNTENLIKSDISIDGTVFGGGEANAAGDEDYDYSFISVTKGINIDIDGNNYSNFNISGSIFGSGNASSTEGYSYIDISNYGTFDNYKENISIQRADIVTIKNSAIKLSGTTDRTNEYSDVEFSISRVKELKLANNSTLFLENGTNLLEKFSSLKIDDKEEQATVTINDDGTVTKNVNNRVYMLEGKNLNIATNEAVTNYGEVNGMTFFGMYQLDRNGEVLTAFYNNKYDFGDTVASGEFYAFTSGSYALGMHKTNHDITKDGFYSNYESEENEGTIEVKYIEPTPSDASYYMWVVGETVTTYELSLTASKYSTLGTYELPLVTSSKPNTTFEILGFNYQNLESDFELVSPDEIDRINTEGTADNKMGLSMESSKSGFVTVGSTNFMTDEQTPISGTTNYKSENSSTVPSFIFYLYHSKNLTQEKKLGTVVISLVAITPIDDLNNEVTRININVNLSSALYTDNQYEGAMTPGEKYDLFASTSTNITNKSKLSAYYSLYMETDEPYYKEGYHHALVSNYVLPKNTKITMIDLGGSSPVYYYKVINDEDVIKATNEYQIYKESSYLLSDFIAMGSTNANNNYNEENINNMYYDKDLGILHEEFIFIVDFGDTNISGDMLNNTLLMEMRNQDDQTLISVLGIQHANLTYSLYDKQSATIDISGTLSKNQIYIGDTVNLDLTTNFISPTVNSITVTDTTYYDKKLGTKITIYDSNGNQLNNSSLLGLSYELDGVTYYPRMDGSVRIPLADRVANVYSRLKINTKNTNLNSGNYTMKIESFGSPDGIYYGYQSSDVAEIPFTIINSRFGLDITLNDRFKIIDKETGFTNYNNNTLIFNMKYSSNLADPNVRISLYRRNYNEVYDMTYTKVNLTDYISNNLIDKGDYTYMFEENPLDNLNKSLYLKENLVSGTYKFVFSLYDGDVYIGDCEEYVIIK